MYGNCSHRHRGRKFGFTIVILIFLPRCLWLLLRCLNFSRLYSRTVCGVCVCLSDVWQSVVVCKLLLFASVEWDRCNVTVLLLN
jgi:hypothetical protein